MERRMAMDRGRGLAPFEGGALARRLFGDFDRFFEDVGVPWFRRRGWYNEFAWVPEMEIAEREGRLKIHVDLPGLKKEEITVTATDGYLTIEGERKYEAEEKKNEWFHTERTYGKFARTVALPEGVKPTEIVATFENGVLEVTAPLPVAAAAEPQKIPVAGVAEKKAVKAA
jgi:HSP20 family protein